MSQLTLPFDSDARDKTRVSPDRARARRIAAETSQILDAGGYRNGSGGHVDLSAVIENAVHNTIHFREGEVPNVAAWTPRDTVIEVRNETTFSAAKRLEEVGLRTLALNLAAAKSVGGGWKNGARAQEECLCRGSGLSRCLEANREFYEFHRQRGGGLYSDWMMLHPSVPVFRGDEPEEALLDTFWTTSFLTAVAPNAKAVHHATDRIRPAFQRRIEKVLSIALAHNFDALVLGAWGCGAFGNDPRDIAPLFTEAFVGKFKGAFTHAAFAVLDASVDERMVSPFREAFGL